jgi:hypothetical protein
MAVRPSASFRVEGRRAREVDEGARTIHDRPDSPLAAEEGSAMASIFISYRREDSGGHAGRLCDRLTSRFGGDRVFLDIQDIGPGQNFAASIEDTIATCDVVIAVIGPRWLETIQKRAQVADDFVRHEISAALKRRVTVIPVLMGGARMPAGADLPPDLAELSRINAVEIRDERFDQDVAELETFLAGSLGDRGRETSARRPYATRAAGLALLGVAAAAAIAGYFLLRPAERRQSGQQVPAEQRVPVAPMLDGDWVAEMHKPGQRPFRIRLQFQRVGDLIGGTVRYPTGDGTMHDATLEGRTLTFYTTHVPQFESTPATIRFQAEVTADEIRLIATDEGGVATGVATRAAPR